MILLVEDYWEVKKAAHKGRGVFAKKDIAGGSVIGDYVGKVIKTAEDDTHEGTNGLYLMYYHDRASIYPTDINASGVHLINNSCEPNCWMYIYKGHTLFFATRHIFKGEELTVPYLLSPLDKFCDPCTHACRCEGSICTGTMHMSENRFEKWSAFNDAQAKETKRKRIRYGHILPQLSSYPDSIPDAPIYDLFGSMNNSAKVLSDKKLPTVKKIRELIRQTGQILEFPLLKKRILGVQDDEIISATL
jgi:hypothetical protein